MSLTEADFYSHLEEWATVSVDDWNHTNILAYFCYKYEKSTGVRFRLVRSRRGPLSSKESGDFAKLFATLAPEDYKQLNSERKRKIRRTLSWKIFNYINWMFDYKFRRGTASVTGTRIFLAPSVINEFERMYLRYKRKQVNKSSIETILGWAKSEIPDLLESHQLEKVEDLKMIREYAKNYNLDEFSPELRLLSKAKDMGLL